eukprot:2863287-Rhodomonas_salina.1
MREKVKGYWQEAAANKHHRDHDQDEHHDRAKHHQLPLAGNIMDPIRSPRVLTFCCRAQRWSWDVGRLTSGSSTAGRRWCATGQQRCWRWSSGLSVRGPRTAGSRLCALRTSPRLTSHVRAANSGIDSAASEGCEVRRSGTYRAYAGASLRLPTRPNTTGTAT